MNVLLLNVLNESNVLYIRQDNFKDWLKVLNILSNNK